MWLEGSRDQNVLCTIIPRLDPDYNPKRKQGQALHLKQILSHKEFHCEQLNFVLSHLVGLYSKIIVNRAV